MDVNVLALPPRRPLTPGGKETAIQTYKLIGVLFGLLGVGLLVCGILGIIHTDTGTNNGIPYFIGGFIAGIPSLINAAYCAYIGIKASDATTREEKQQLGSMIQCQYCFAILGLGTSGFGVFWSAFYRGGVFLKPNETSESYDITKDIAACTLAGCIPVFILGIISMIIVCNYGEHFGIIFVQGRRGDNSVMINLHDEHAHVPVTNAALFTATNHAHSGLSRQIEEQNRMLRQQIDLQRQLLQQQQQQQQQQPLQTTQYSNGFSRTHPASHGVGGNSVSPAYNIPPPTYNDLFSSPRGRNR